MNINLSNQPQFVRKIILEQSKRAGVGHIGCSLSVVELICAVESVIRSEGGNDRDRFVLSKGHAALALYAALYCRGLLSQEALNSFHEDDSLLGIHPEHKLPGIDFCSGSLGQGLSYAAGAAFAAKLQGSQRRAFALLSDAECNEGSIWEAAMFSAQRRLGNLIAMIDLNGQQALGYTRDVCMISSMADCWRSFGWNTHELDGHDVNALRATLQSCIADDSSKPHVIIAKTTFGKGVSFMENKIQWHYLPMDDAEFAQAMKEVSA